MSCDDLIGKIRDDDVVRRLFRPEYGGDVYLVGGALREMILGREPNDYDVVLSRTEDLAVVSNIFRTRPFLLGKKALQTYRIVSDSAIIDVTFLADTIDNDLKRRDFTINALAFGRDGDRIIDPCGGLHDIADRIIRTPARKNLEDDPLRMVKAVRHFATLPGFRLDGSLMEDCRALSFLVCQSAPERIKYELDHIITATGPDAALQVLQSTGLLFHIFPELMRLHELDERERFDLKTLGHTIDGFAYLDRFGMMANLSREEVRNVGYALLFHDLGKADRFLFDEDRRVVHFYHHEKVSRDLAHEIMVRLRFSTHDMRVIEFLIINHMRIFLLASSGSSERGIRRLVYQAGDLTPHLIVHTLCDLYGSSGGEDNPSTLQVRETCRHVEEAFEEWKMEPVPPLINGRDLLALGFKEGPSVGNLLRSIRDRQIGGDLRTRQEALDLAEAFLRQIPSDDDSCESP